METNLITQQVNELRALVSNTSDISPEVIDSFLSTVDDLNAKATKAKAITITGTEDVNGYKQAVSIRKELKKSRNQVEKAGKSMREYHTKVNRSIMAIEKSLISLIEPEERRLAGLQVQIDTQISREKELARRQQFLPDRRNLLASLGIEVTDEFILEKNDEQFSAYFLEQKQRIMDEQAAAIEAEKKRMEDERRKIEEDKKQIEIEANLAKAREEAAEQARADALKQAEIDKINAEKALADAVAAERQRQAEAELRRIAQEKADKLAAEAAEKEQLAKIAAAEEANKRNEKYKEWLRVNGWTEKTHSITKSPTGSYILWKKVSEITL